MKKLSRAKNTMRNTLWGAIYRVATLIGPFAIKTIIIKELGQEYNGLSTLFTSVLTVLNLANLGFNSSLVFTMYKAIAEDDKPALCAMLKFYRKVYRIVGLVILGMGLAVMPFLPWLVKNECPPDVNLYVLFAIYLSESVLDYLMFAYNNATFTAFQRNDVTLKISTVRYVVQYTLQAAVLLIFSNYYAYIILLPLMVIPNNVAVYLAARKHYPDIVCQGELDPVTKKDIYKRVGTLFGHKLGNTFLVSIDSIIISSFLGLTALSLYSNYYYILTAVNGLVEIVTNGSLSGIRHTTDSAGSRYNAVHILRSDLFPPWHAVPDIPSSGGTVRSLPPSDHPLPGHHTNSGEAFRSRNPYILHKSPLSFCGHRPPAHMVRKKDCRRLQHIPRNETLPDIHIPRS